MQKAISAHLTVYSIIYLHVEEWTQFLTIYQNN